MSTDLSKAFDTLSHDLLLEKLQTAGLGSKAVDWIKSYLTDRKQQVKMGSTTSSISTVQAGVPQGSILGPLLFITYTADLASNLSDCKVTAYADDTQILVTAKSETELKTKVEKTILEAQHWYAKNSLKLNPTKTELMIFGKKNSQINPMYFAVQDGSKTEQIKTSPTMKILGVIIDEKLTWEKHATKVKVQAYRNAVHLARTSSVLSLKSRRTLYDALVAPHYNYCDVVWGGMAKKYSQQIQKSGNFAARTMLGQSKRSSATQALIKLDMMPLSEKRKVHLAVLVHKFLKSEGPKALVEDYAGLINRDHNYHTRAKSRKDLRTITRKTSKFDGSTKQRAITLWNSIPETLRGIECTSSFKKKYQCHLLQIFKSDHGLTHTPESAK